MIERIKNAFEGSRGGPKRSDGGAAIAPTSQNGTRNQQYRLDTDKQETARTAVDFTEPADPPVELDRVFEILKNQRRRYVLRYLSDIDGQVRLGELAEQIAAWEYEKDVRQISSQERKRVYVGLYQSHLPKMDDAGVISYNKSRGTIEIGENIAFFEQYLPVDDQSTKQSSRGRSWLAWLKQVLPIDRENH
ncbi:DUF7344 domain-containing protein [Halorhabdus rudnickae]|uniref:DUF7344 domain-containing protein n=1 Tax=Halorhabdus rudnickae TaxID=1775544 RepID=UPI001083084C|nr:ArsR family transcriptional regulator [Halorhabdus rudnickae]